MMRARLLKWFRSKVWPHQLSKGNWLEITDRYVCEPQEWGHAVSDIVIKYRSSRRQGLDCIEVRVLGRITGNSADFLFTELVGYSADGKKIEMEGEMHMPFFGDDVVCIAWHGDNLPAEFRIVVSTYRFKE